MSEGRSDTLYSAWLEGTTKLDYYIVGIVLALVAYWGKEAVPFRFAVSRDSVAVLGLLFLIASAYIGLRRIETSLLALHANFDLSYHDELAGALIDAAAKSPMILNRADATLMSAEQAVQRAQRAKDQRRIIEGAFEKLADKGVALYKWRDRCLIVGLTLTLGSKVWPHSLH